MSAYTLNIGLGNLPAHAGDTLARRVSFVEYQLRAHSFLSMGARVVNSDSEPTLVVEVAFFSLASANRIARLSAALNQDCIAVLSPDGTGALVGPRAAQWGDFNPEYFFLLDGSRLSAA